jgi:hypothetical protein
MLNPLHKSLIDFLTEPNEQFHKTPAAAALLF